MRMTANVRMDSHRKAEFIILPIKVVEMVPPQIFHIPWVNPAVRVWRLLDEHHRWQIIEIPAGWDFDETSIGTFFEWLHPVIGVLVVVNLGPFVTSAKKVGQTVVVREAMVWSSPRQEEIPHRISQM